MNFEQEFAQKYGLVRDQDYWFHTQSGKLIIKHDAVVRIAYEEKITLTIDRVIDDSDDHKAVMVFGSKQVEGGPLITATMLGECAVGKSGITAMYPWAMAQKRGEDRCVLRIVAPGGGVYSDDESPDFRKGGANATEVAAAQPRRQQQPTGGAPAQGVSGGGNPRPQTSAPAADHIPDGLSVPTAMMGMVFGAQENLGFGKNSHRQWGEGATDPEFKKYLEWMVKSSIANSGNDTSQWKDRSLSALHWSQQTTPEDDVPF